MSTKFNQIKNTSFALHEQRGIQDSLYFKIFDISTVFTSFYTFTISPTYIQVNRISFLRPNFQNLVHAIHFDGCNVHSP